MKEEVLETKFQCAGTGRKVKESESINDYFWHFWEDYSRDLYRECLKMMKGSAEDAMDALETAMIFAHERFPRHAAEIYNLKGWLIRLTRNVCIDIHRKNKRESLYKENLYKVGGINERLTDEGPWSESIENTLEREEILNKVFISMKKLPQRLREPAILRFFFKMKHREIAWHCNISDTNVRKRIQQARNILQNDLREFREDLDYFLLQGKNKRNDTFSSTLGEISGEMEMILKREFQEINCIYTTSNLVQLTLPSGIEKSIIIFFDGSLNRQKVKIKTLQDYVKCFPGGWKKRLELAKLLYAGGNWEQSATEFQKVLKKNPQSLEARLYLAGIHMGFEEEEKAVITLEAAIPFAHTEASQRHIGGLIELCRHRVQPALAAFNRAITLEKSNVAHQHKLAMSYLLADQPAAAQEAFEKILITHSHDLFSLTHGCECLISLGRLEKAERYVERILEINSHDIFALGHKIEQRCRRGLTQYEEGKNTRKLIRKMKLTAPQTAEVNETQAIFLFYRGESKMGLKLLKDFTRQRSKCPSGWYNYGCWLYRNGFYRLAGQAVFKSFTLYKKNPRIYGCICDILSHAGMKDELRIVTQDMLERYPYRWSICISAALVLVNVFGDTRQAWELSKRAVELQPQLPEAYFYCGRILGTAGKSGEAIDTILKGWRLLGIDDAGLQSTPAAWDLSQYYEILGREREAKAWLEETILRAEKLKKFYPADAYYWEGKARFKSGDIDGAGQALKKSLSSRLFYPRHQEARSILKDCRAGEK